MKPVLDIRHAKIVRTGLTDPADQKRPVENQDPAILLETTDLQFEGGKIYTMEGANQAGKSTLVAAILGVHGRKGNSGAAPMSVALTMLVDGKDRNFTSPGHAARHGLSAVFQDDDLIATLTVREQLLLRHAVKGIPAILRWMYKKNISDGIEDLIGYSRHITDIQNHFIPTLPAVLSKQEVEERAVLLLDSFSQTYDYKTILDKRPIELSGGAKAIARLVSALLTPNLKLLFLDEVFRGVQADVWPYIVDALRDVAVKNNICFVVISHNKDEIVRWQPMVRLGIANGKLHPIEPKGHSSIIPAIEIGPDYYPVFEVKQLKHEQWQGIIEKFCVILVDKALEKTPSYIKLRNKIADITDNKFIVVAIGGGEQNKTVQNYQTIAQQVCEGAHFPIGSFVVIGGGVALNLGGMVAATVNRGTAKITLVPTTLMALSDVAVGSKVGINILSSTGGPLGIRKHGLGVYRNPDAVLVDRDFLRNLPQREIFYGMSECLKHGLCQSTELFRESLAVVAKSGNCPDGQAHDLGMQTLNLKSQILSLDPGESNIGRILQFGHLHAHALERATSFEIPHGIAVYWGILLDCILGQTKGLEYPLAVGEIVAALKGGTLFTNFLPYIGSANLLDHYEADSKQYHRSKQDDFTLLTLPQIGRFSAIYEFKNESLLKPFMKDFSRAEISSAIAAAIGLF